MPYVNATFAGVKRNFIGVINSSAVRDLDKRFEQIPTPTATYSANFYQGFQMATTLVSLHRFGHFNVEINSLVTLRLRTSMSVVVEPDDDAFIARNNDLPLFGLADDWIGAVSSLQKEIESLYYDLMEDDNFSDQWMAYKKLLRDKVILP